MTDMRTSIVRTVVPVIVGILLTQATKAGIHFDEKGTSLTEVVTVVVTSLYYSIARWAEAIKPKLGWLLGKPSKPQYNA